MNDLENLIFDALEGNAIEFQKGIAGELESRAAAAIEQLKPEVASRFFGATVAEEAEQVDEVALPKSPSDKVATNIPVSKKDHPVANEVQFTAKNEKDKSKKASYHAGEDEVAYQAAQNVGVLPKE